MLVQIAEIKETIDAAKQMVRGNVGVEIETVEQWSLRNFLASHHLDALDLRRKYSTADRTSRSAKRASFSTELAEVRRPHLRDVRHPPAVSRSGRRGAREGRGTDPGT